LSTYGIPQGGIIIWSGASNNIPSGWVLCDGNNSTPDLRNRFVLGAGNSYSVGAQGGATTHTLTVDEIPAHTHTYIDQYVVINAGYRPWPANNNDCNNRNIDSGSTGGGQAHNNMPPYYALCYIMKT
jgi:microcystin-dependent protein